MWVFPYSFGRLGPPLVGRPHRRVGELRFLVFELPEELLVVEKYALVAVVLASRLVPEASEEVVETVRVWVSAAFQQHFHKLPASSATGVDSLFHLLLRGEFGAHVAVDGVCLPIPRFQSYPCVFSGISGPAALGPRRYIRPSWCIPFAAMDSLPSRTEWVKLPLHGRHPPVDVSIVCRKSSPCKHFVMYVAGGAPEALYGPSVAQLFIDRNLPVPPHFSEYVNAAGETFWPDETIE